MKQFCMLFENSLYVTWNNSICYLKISCMLLETKKLISKPEKSIKKTTLLIVIIIINNKIWYNNLYCSIGKTIPFMKEGVKNSEIRKL